MVAIPNPTRFASVFVHDLRLALDVQRQLTRALPLLMKAAHSDELRAMLETALEESRGHGQRIELVLRELGAPSASLHCQALAGIVDDAECVWDGLLDGDVLDACLIAVAQRIAYYQIATYTSLIAWAESLEHQTMASIIGTIVDEVIASNGRLTQLAEDDIIAVAASGAAAVGARGEIATHL